MLLVFSVLPELPVPGPSSAGPSNAGENLLGHHSAVAEGAAHVLQVWPLTHFFLFLIVKTH